MKSILQRGGLYVTLPTAAAVIIYALVFYLPNRRQIDRLRHELHTRRQVTGCETKTATIVERQRELEETQSYVAHWQRNLPREDHVVQVQAEIAEIVADSGALATQISPGEETLYPSLVWMSLKMELSGSFPEVFDFFRRLEQIPRMVWVDDLQILAPHEAGKDLECEVNLIVFRDHSENSD